VEDLKIILGALYKKLGEETYQVEDKEDFITWVLEGVKPNKVLKKYLEDISDTWEVDAIIYEINSENHGEETSELLEDLDNILNIEDGTIIPLGNEKYYYKTERDTGGLPSITGIIKIIPGPFFY